ncbi:MAG TPA: hypothetical protein VNT60_10415 [Deinococcales bacterium]|nr:hypothetical protein [Deinococcales bacterium]
MTTRRIPALLAAILLLGGLASAQRQVTTEGQAAPPAGQPAINARQLALDDALRNAVETGVGIFLSSETQTKNYELISDTILKKAAGFARLDQIVSEGATPDGRYVVRVRATVQGQAIATSLRAIIKNFNDPRIAVYLDETVDGRQAPGAPASTAIAKALNDAGFRVLDPKQVEQNAGREAALAAARDPKTAAQLASRLRVDMLLVGNARAAENTNPSPELTRAGIKSYSGIVEMRLVDATSSQIVWTDQFTDAAVGTNPDAASTDALKKAVEKTASTKLLDGLKKIIQPGAAASNVVYVLKVSGFTSFSAFNNFVQTLSTAAGITAVQARDYDSAGTLIDVEFGGSTTALATLLETLGVTVTGITGREISAKTK